MSEIMTESHRIAESNDRFTITNINRVRRHTERAHYDRGSVFGILDRAHVAHVAFVVDGRPMVIPMAFGRDGDRLYLHGARKSRITTAPEGQPVCISVTLVDGFVVARSAFDSSMNYRAVVIHGHATEVVDEAERLRALRCITEQLLPGRWSELSPPTDHELKATAVLAVEIETASAKVREGDVIHSANSDERVWAGVVPIASVVGVPLTDASVPGDVPVPESVRRMRGA
jgi:nitroimidazol reductase NimA-like FMN-containing flavoprotein (pyridoxamine 5'-phosphate oxidase superfamily)